MPCISRRREPLYNLALKKEVVCTIWAENEREYLISHPASGKLIWSPKSQYGTKPPVFDTGHFIAQKVNYRTVPCIRYTWKGPRNSEIDILECFYDDATAPDSRVVVEDGEVWIIRKNRPYRRIDGKGYEDGGSRLYYPPDKHRIGSYIQYRVPKYWEPKEKDPISTPQLFGRYEIHITPSDNKETIFKKAYYILPPRSRRWWYHDYRSLMNKLRYEVKKDVIVLNDILEILRSRYGMVVRSDLKNN